MPLKGIVASWECDGCGRTFSVGLDSAAGPVEGWGVYEYALDAVRGSPGYEGPNTSLGFGGISSVRGDKALCGACTEEADARD
jgi:hypothetical protein